MKNLLLVLLMLFGIGLNAQHTQTAIEGRSIEFTQENQRLITIGIPIVKIMKVGEQVTVEDLNKFHPYNISDGSIPLTEAAPASANLDSTMLNMIKCMMSSGGIECQDIGCDDPVEKVEAGVWRIMFAGGIFKGLYTYWIQGQVEPLLNYHNGVIRFNGMTVQIYQLVGNDKPLVVGDDLRFYVD